MTDFSHPFEQFKTGINRLKTAIEKAELHNLDLNQKVDLTKSIYNFDQRKLDSLQREIIQGYKQVVENIYSLNEISAHSTDNQLKVARIMGFVETLKGSTRSDLKLKLNKITELINHLKIPELQRGDFTCPENLPSEIKDEVMNDFKEMIKCYNARCYKSSTILCGRILETCLHSKYYQVTGTDILEKSPGIGLGNLIAKMAEKNIELDPALTQQIHLINQVRIITVHKKKIVFYPSENQTKAIILYTLDIIDKLFKA